MFWTSFVAAVGVAVFGCADARTALGVRERLVRARSSGVHHSLIVQDSGKAEQQLRVCNAFAHVSPLEITHVRSSTHLGSLKYKDCDDYMLQLVEGDQLDFKAGAITVGTFAVTGVPQKSRTLLLIVQKRAGPSMGASFKSHAFSEQTPGASQVAIIDAYSGTAQDSHKVTISKASEANATLRSSEDLPMNAVMSINPGYYQVGLSSAGEAASAKLTAEEKTSYVVFRVGQGSPTAKGGFPEELVVFPQSGAARSAALSMGLLLAAALQLSVF